MTAETLETLERCKEHHAVEAVRSIHDATTEADTWSGKQHLQFRDALHLTIREAKARMRRRKGK